MDFGRPLTSKERRQGRYIKKCIESKHIVSHKNASYHTKTHCMALLKITWNCIAFNQTYIFLGKKKGLFRIHWLKK